MTDNGKALLEIFRDRKKPSRRQRTLRKIIWDLDQLFQMASYPSLFKKEKNLPLRYLYHV